GRAEKELDQLLQTTFFGRPSRRAEAARPKAQKQTETGRPTRTPGTSSTLGSLGGSERHGGAVAEAMPALRREPAAKARPGAYGRGAAGGSGDRSASGEGAPHRVSVSQRGLWALRKGDAGAAARGDQRGLWTAVDGADRLLEGSLPVAAAAGGSHAGRCAGHRDQFGEYPESLGRSQPGGRTARSAVAGAVAARSGPECGGDGVADQRRQALDLGRWWRTSLCFMWGPPRAALKCWYRCWARFSAAFFAAIVGWFIGRTIPGGCSYAGLTGRGTFWGLPIMRAAPRRSNFAETHWRLWLGCSVSGTGFAATCGTGAGIRSPLTGGNSWKNRLCARIRQPPSLCWVSLKRGSGFRGQAKAAESLWGNADRRFVGIPDPLEGQSCKWRLACGSALKSPCSLGSRRVPVTQPDCHESQESGSPEGSHLVG